MVVRLRSAEEGGGVTAITSFLLSPASTANAAIRERGQKAMQEVMKSGPFSSSSSVMRVSFSSFIAPTTHRAAELESDADAADAPSPDLVSSPLLLLALAAAPAGEALSSLGGGAKKAASWNSTAPTYSKHKKTLAKMERIRLQFWCAHREAEFAQIKRDLLLVLAQRAQRVHS
jgi:hypothetical protein